MGEGRLAQARRTVEQQVVEGLLALEGGLDGNLQVVFQLVLTDELGKAPRAQRIVQGLVVVTNLGGDQALFGAQAGASTGGLYVSVGMGGLRGSGTGMLMRRSPGYRFMAAGCGYAGEQRSAITGRARWAKSR